MLPDGQPPAPAGRAAPWRTLRLAGGLLLMALAFVAGCLAFHRLLPFPEIGDVRAKYTHFTEHANDYDTLFIGSSRLNNQLMPAVFDRTTAAAGIQTKTFNGAIAGMRPPEDSYLFDRLMEGRPQKLRYVFVELNNVPERLDESLKVSLRGQYWHDLPRTLTMWDRLNPWAGPNRKKKSSRFWRNAQENLAEFAVHLELFAREMTNLGKGDVFARRLHQPAGNYRLAFPSLLGDDLSGFRPSGRPEEMEPFHREIYEKEQAQLLENPPVFDSSDNVGQRALERLLSKIEKLGATPVLVIAPRAGPRIFYPRPERARRTIILNLNDRRRFPVLFENRYRLDHDHLNLAGSAIFTRILAEEFAAAVKERAATP